MALLKEEDVGILDYEGEPVVGVAFEREWGEVALLPAQPATY